MSQNQLTSGEEKTGEHPPSEEQEQQKDIFVQVSEPAKISSQKDLDSVVERHQLWIAEVLNPKSEAAAGRACFRGVDLRGYSLTGMDLRCADFTGAVLDGCNLGHANLSGCLFVDASLRGADLRGAPLKRTVFSGADLEGVALDPEAEELFQDRAD